MRPKTYVILERAVEEGYRRGWARAHKHVEAPGTDHLEAEIVRAIMGDICEVFSFSDDDVCNP